MSSTPSFPPKSLTIYYVDYNFWRGECSRIALFMAGIEYEDSRKPRSFLQELRKQGKSPFGSWPILEIDGTHVLSQTQAIAAYTGKLAKMYPEDPWLSAKVDELLNGCTDITEILVKTMSIQDNEEKIKTRQELITKEGGRLYLELNGLNQIISASKYAVGDSLTIADLAIWSLIRWVDGGSIDGISKHFVREEFPALKSLFETVDALPKVKEWKEKHAKFYADKK